MKFKMKALGSLVKNIRSKNAGPYWVTIDVFCKNKKSFAEISNKLNIDLLSRAFKIKKNTNPHAQELGSKQGAQ